MLLKTGGEIVFLIKPQFEAGREHMKKSGVVRDRKIHIDVIEHVIGFATDNGFCIKDITFSPIKGPKGNMEFLAYAIKDDFCDSVAFDVSVLVDQAHLELSDKTEGNEK
jgi:23S rRNA (cytidine1920-2'-O)/16S rRNA (cytidine1409-2'-O)-methyltransferase